jgi:hypothetical protein
MTRRRSTIKGAASFRRLLRRLPDGANARLLALLNEAGPVLAGFMRSALPVLAHPKRDRVPGALRASISWRVTPKSLNLKVGQLSKKDLPFYGHILDVGRKAKTVRVTRVSRRGGAPYNLRVRPLAGLHVTARTKAGFVNRFIPEYRQLMDQVLADASQGAGDD